MASSRVAGTVLRQASFAKRSVCVSIHDVAPETWPQCETLLQAIRAVATIPVTLLVVPDYHHHRSSHPGRFDDQLEHCMSQGAELALHGYAHLDEARAPQGLREHFLRRIYTTGEGEFAAIELSEAIRRIELGLAWFAQRQWPVEGFVAPAWLLGEQAWAALLQFQFSYTTTLRYFYLLPEKKPLLSPSLVYFARNEGGRLLSRAINALLMQALQNAAVARLSLHPSDAHHPDVVAHFQQLLEKLLMTRTARTKAAFARACVSTSGYALTHDCG